MSGISHIVFSYFIPYFLPTLWCSLLAPVISLVSSLSFCVPSIISRAILSRASSQPASQHPVGSLQLGICSNGLVVYLMSWICVHSPTRCDFVCGQEVLVVPGVIFTLRSDKTPPRACVNGFHRIVSHSTEFTCDVVYTCV